MSRLFLAFTVGFALGGAAAAFLWKSKSLKQQQTLSPKESAKDAEDETIPLLSLLYNIAEETSRKGKFIKAEI